MFPLSLFTGRLFSVVWDDYVDLRGYIRKLRMPNQDKEELFKIIIQLKQDLSGWKKILGFIQTGWVIRG